MDEEFLATAYPKVHENLKLITDERVIEDNPESHSGSMSSMKNLEDTDNFGDQFLYDKPTEDDQEKSKVVNESDSTIPDLSHQTSPQLSQRSLHSSALALRVAKLEQDMSEVKKTDHSAAVLASIKSQVPTVVDKYLGTKLDDALLRILERHTADLIEKYSVLPGPESIKNQESKKSLKEIIIIKKKQEQDCKQNPANFHLYRAIMEALIADEDAIDKEVKDHKRKHDSDDDKDDDDDVEGPSAGSNQDNWQMHTPQRIKFPRKQASMEAYDIGSFIQWFCRRRKKKLCKADLEGPAFNLVKAFHKNNVKETNNCLTISKLKAARYLDFGLEELVPSLWVESERDYDISAAYGITHWWFSRKQFYINKHSEPSDREAVRSQMRILSVIRVKTFEKYGYNYLREIILCRADYKEYKISKKDFKNLHPNDFEDL
ncbi:hypothetical protein Tco_0823665 [Tanacetum coccineum]|uniref:Uncharacterized protein n=2 Tax=Tanacetum coccineum TaxID=301880 RepID=A0ABQ5AII2_9ASTR